MRNSVTESLLAIIAVQILAATAVVVLHGFQSGLRRALPYVISIAVGVLLTTGVAHLIPEAVDSLGNRTSVWLTIVVTIVALYSLERAFQVFSGVTAEPATDTDIAHLHGHHDHHHASKPATLLFGSLMHSLVDGTGIAVAFSVSHRLGWTAALAVGLHEVPHRLGDFALLVHMGVARTRAALLSITAGASCVLGWSIVAIAGEHWSHEVAWLLPVSAGSFLYIGLVDLLPELQNEHRPKTVFWQILSLVAGIVLAWELTLISVA